MSYNPTQRRITISEFLPSDLLPCIDEYLMPHPCSKDLKLFNRTLWCYRGYAAGMYLYSLGKLGQEEPIPRPEHRYNEWIIYDWYMPPVILRRNRTTGELADVKKVRVRPFYVGLPVGWQPFYQGPAVAV